MNNRAKIYTLYFATQSLTVSISKIVKQYGNSVEADSQEIFNTIFEEAKKQYYRLKQSKNSKILLVEFHANRALEKITTRIENYLGELEDENIDLIYCLWIALDFALTRYFSVKADKSNLIYEIEDRLRLGYNKYLAMSQPQRKSKFKKRKIAKIFTKTDKVKLKML